MRSERHCDLYIIITDLTLGMCRGDELNDLLHNFGGVVFAVTDIGDADHCPLPEILVFDLRDRHWESPTGALDDPAQDLAFLLERSTAREAEIDTRHSHYHRSTALPTCGER